MRRIGCTPRAGWRETIAAQGLLFSRTDHPDGSVSDYWNESAAYVFTLDEVTALEQATEELHRMCGEAARYLASGALGTLGLSPAAFAFARASLDRAEPDFYARFDLVYDEPGKPPKLYEYNADTPTGLIEAAVVQWYWKEDAYPAYDQWNGIHEALTARWSQLRAGDPRRVLHVAHTAIETTGEDWATSAYVRDTADQAGWETIGITMEDIGWDARIERFVDLEGRPIADLFKLYPWEDLISEPFGAHVLEHPRTLRWYEPPWKMFWSTKLLLPALWHCYPGHPLLLPAYAGDPQGMTDYVAKPIFGREGEGIGVVRDGRTLVDPAAHAPLVYQAYHPLPSFPDADGHIHRPVLGSWVVAGESWGVGVRESDGDITDARCRFVPNLISG